MSNKYIFEKVSKLFIDGRTLDIKKEDGEFPFVFYDYDYIQGKFKNLLEAFDFGDAYIDSGFTIGETDDYGNRKGIEIRSGTSINHTTDSLSSLSSTNRISPISPIAALGSGSYFSGDGGCIL